MPMQAYADIKGVNSEAQDKILKASKISERLDASALLNTADNVTYTAAQVLDGIIRRDCNGGARTDVLPTAALLLGAMQQEEIGDVVKCLFINESDAAETITLSAGAGGSFAQPAATLTIPQNTSRMAFIRVTDAATPTYVAYM